jgi:hypothetical protein
MDRRDFLKKTVSVLATPLLTGISGCTKKTPDKRDPKGSTKSEQLSRIILSYMASPGYVSEDFTRQITGTEAELEIYDLGERMLYFSLPDDQDLSSAISRLSKAPENAEMAELEGSRLHVGTYYYSTAGRYFFRMPDKDFKIDSKKKYQKRYSQTSYDISVQELADFLRNKSIYGGKLYIEKQDGKTAFANHGVFVAKKSEASLERLVTRLTDSCVTVEEEAQRLLDFISEDISYDYKEASSSRETLKRPNEVLMSGSSDCSGKTILYASLLEQAGIDYRIIYSEGHVNIAVEGDFPLENGLNFGYQGKNFFIAEPTCSGFKIGRSRLNGFKISDMEYLQDPGQAVVDARTGKKV